MSYFLQMFLKACFVTIIPKKDIGNLLYCLQHEIKTVINKINLDLSDLDMVLLDFALFYQLISFCVINYSILQDCQHS